MNNEPASETAFAIQMVCLVLVPPLVMGLVIAALSGAENGFWGMVIGGIVGVGAARLRNEVRAMRLAD